MIERNTKQAKHSNNRAAAYNNIMETYSHVYDLKSGRITDGREERLQRNPEGGFALLLLVAGGAAKPNMI
jgi:hypothetical protein